MLSLRRRHTKKCNEKWAERHKKNAKEPAKLDAKELKKCDCNLWVMGTDCRGQLLWETLDTENLTTASLRMQTLERGERWEPSEAASTTITDAYAKYLGIIQSQRGVKDTSIEQTYHTIRNHLVAYLEPLGITTIQPITVDHMDGLVLRWKNLENSTRHHYIQILQDFFRVATSRKWISEDPSIHLVRPKRIAGKRTLPFDLEKEDPKIIQAIPFWYEGIKKYAGTSAWAKNPENASALIYTLRFTGLRISDACFRFDPREIVIQKVDGGEVYCYYLREQQKTGEPVFIVIPSDVAEYIIAAPRLSEKYAFYDPEDTDTADSKSDEKAKIQKVHHRQQWETRFRQNVLRYLSAVSGVPNIRPHRFRDTFAVDLLNKDVDIRAVSRFLGHTDIASTLKHYEHWIANDQTKAIRKMMGAWGEAKPNNVIRFPGRQLG